jgi:hypothetical protein
LHHAITGRFARARADSGSIEFLDEIGLLDYRSADHFEQAIEDHSLSEIEECCKLLESIRTQGGA